MHSITIKVLRQWDGKQKRTEDLVPSGCSSVLLDWNRDPPLDEGGLPIELATALAEALLEHGTVAGRWFYDTPVPLESYLRKQKRQNPVQWALGRIFNTWPAPVVTTQSCKAVCELLDHGWGMQDQALLILDHAIEVPSDAALHTLSVNRDWTGFTFPPPTRALIAPGNDGDYILVAAATEASLRLVLDSILDSFRSSGFTVTEWE